MLRTQNMYYGHSYINPGRFSSYGLQIKEIMSLTPDNVLEVGVGNGVVSYILRQAGFNVTTMDSDASLNPDVVASVIKMPFDDECFDLVACFEVLEHLQWEMVTSAVSELSRVARGNIVVSLPDKGWLFAMEIHLPKLGRFKIASPCPGFIRWLRRSENFDDEHYWEIGRGKITNNVVMEVFSQAGLRLKKTYRNTSCPWHRFFVWEKIA